MYDLTFGQNGHFGKIQPKKPCVFHAHAFNQNEHCFVNVDTLVKLNLLKNHDFL